MQYLFKKTLNFYHSPYKDMNFQETIPYPTTDPCFPCNFQVISKVFIQSVKTLVEFHDLIFQHFSQTNKKILFPLQIHFLYTASLQPH